MNYSAAASDSRRDLINKAQVRDADKRLDHFDFQFNARIDGSPGLPTGHSKLDRIARRRPFFLVRPGAGKVTAPRPLATPSSFGDNRVLYREAHRLLEELADATLDGKRKEFMELVTTVPLLIIDDPGMRKLPVTAAEQLLEIIMRRYERASSLLTSNRPVDDYGGNCWATAPL